MKTKILSVFLIVCAIFFLVPISSPGAVNVTTKIKIPLQSSTFQAPTTTNSYFLKNSSTATFAGPFRVFIESLNNRDVALVNPDGHTPEGKPTSSGYCLAIAELFSCAQCWPRSRFRS